MAVTSDDLLIFDSPVSENSASRTCWQCSACTLINSTTAVDCCKACYTERPADAAASTTATNNAIVPSTKRRGPRPLVGRGSVGVAFLSSTGKFFSRSAKTVTNVAKDTAHVVSEKTKKVYETHDVAGKSQRAVATTKNSAVAARSKFRKFDEQTNFTSAVIGIATLKAANDIKHGRAKSGTVALGIAGAGLATKHNFRQDRDRENKNKCSTGRSDTSTNTNTNTNMQMQMPLNQICPGFKEGSTSKGILMHSKNYKLDQVTVEKITKLNHELDSIEHKIKRLAGSASPGGIKGLGGGGGFGGKDAIACGGEEMTRKVAQHLITGIMCQLDMIDVGDSDTLRDIRRKVLHRAEAVDRLWGGAEKEGNDTEI